MSLFGGILQAFGVGAPNKYSAVPTPNYKTDPNFDATQSYLRNWAEAGMRGEFPDWYKQIGEVAPESLTGGLVTGATNDVVKRALESQAAKTGRSGSMGADTMSAIGNMSAGLRYQDWLRAMQGRQDLLGASINTESGVRQNAFNNMGAENQFDQWKYGQDVNENTKAWQASNARKAYTGGALVDIANSGDEIANLFGLQGAAGNQQGFGEAPMSYIAPSSDKIEQLMANPIIASSGAGRANTSGGTDWMASIMKYLPMLMGA